MPVARWILLGSLGLASLFLAAVLLLTIDPNCEASGAYGNYCGLQQPHIWGYPAALLGIVLLVGALIWRRREARSASIPAKP